MKSKIVTIYLFIFLGNVFSQTVIPASDELVLPKYLLGGTVGGVTANRLQYVCMLKLSGLTPNATYRYLSGASISATLTTSISPGCFFVINNAPGTAGYITGQSSGKSVGGTLMSGNEFVTTSRYGEFQTDASGVYWGWFSTVATTNASFTTAGNQVYFYVQLNNGAGGTSLTQAYRTTSTITVVDYGTTSGSLTQGSAIMGKSVATAEDMILLYDNQFGLGRPLFATWTENDGIPTNYTTWYNPAGGNGVDGNIGRWGAIIPNNLPTGLMRIERRAIDFTLIDYANSSDGMWNGLNTVNPSAGSTPVVIDSLTAPLPVTMTEFNAYLNRNSVQLKWTTSIELNNKGFEIQTSSDQAAWNTIGFISGSGNSSVVNHYSYQHANLNSGKHYYRIRQVDFNGNSEFFNCGNAVTVGTPESYSALQNYPNPFNPATEISFSIPENSNVKLKVFDAAGKLVNELVNTQLEKGYHSVSFDGSKLASGVYFYQLTASDNSGSLKFSKITKMVLLK